MREGMKIIGSTSAWQKDLGKALGELKELGFEEVDLIAIEAWGLVSPASLVSNYQAERDRVWGLLKQHGLKAVSMNAAFKPDLGKREDEAGNRGRLEQVKAVARFMAESGIGIAAHYPGHIASHRNDPEGVWKDTTRSLREIQEAAREWPVTLAPEIHFNTPFEKPDAARRLLKEMPDLKYTYEPSHFIVQGIDVRETADLLEGASHVHIRGCAEGRLQAPPSESETQLRWMIDQLLMRDYEGYVSIEYLPKADFDTRQAIEEMREKLEEWIS